MNNQRDADTDPALPWRVGGELHSPRLSIGDGEIVVILTRDVSRARDLVYTLASSGEAPGQAAAIVRRTYVDPSLTVRDNLEVPLRQAGVGAATAEQQIPVAAASLGLLDSLDARTKILTARQQDRVRLAQQAIQPTALLFPDSFVRLPGEDSRRLRSKVLDLRRAIGRRTLLVENVLDDIQLGADWIAVVDEAEVRQMGAPRYVYEHPVDLYTAARFGRHSLLLADAQREGEFLQTPLGRVKLPRDIPDLAHRQILIGLRPESLSSDPGDRDRLRLAVRVARPPTYEQLGVIDQNWSRSFVLPNAALRAGLVPRVVGVSLPDDAITGQQVYLSADPGRIMLFDAATGQNILGDHVLADFGEVTAAAEARSIVTDHGSGRLGAASPETGSPGAATAAQPTPVRRFLQCDHPSSVQRGSDFVIRTQVTAEAGAGGRAFKTDTIPPQGAELLLVIYADRFVARTDATVSLRLPQQGDSEVAAFVLTAPMKTGRYRLLLRVFRGNAQLAEQPLSVEVSDNPTAPSTQSATSPLADAMPRPNVVRLIVARANRKYQYVLASDDPSVPSISISNVVPKSPDRQLRTLVKCLNDMAAGKGYTPSDARETLRDQGRELWNTFVPDELADRLQSLDVTRSILWISTFGESEKVPWEMLHSIEQIGGRDDFLACIFPTVRSPAGSEGLADELRMHRAEVVLPDPNLTEASEEVSAIRHILDGRADVGADIREKAKLRLVLEGGGFSLLHVAGHNDYGKGSGLILAAGQRLRPPDLNGLASAGGRWAASGPMVFLNACGTDQSERTYTGVMDWAQKCFEAGASAFVGSLWDVRSKPARAFATCFYEKLFDDGQPLAMAAHLARQQARQKSGKDPTWLAYTVYGNPFARVVST